jgi:hypothetical protein
LDKNKTEIDKLKSEIPIRKKVNTLYKNVHHTEGTAGTKS